MIWGLLATTAPMVGTLAAVPAQAQAQAVRSYDIPAGPLPAVLSRFIEASGAAVVYDAGLARNASSPGLKGSCGTAEALSRLLAGTGLTYRQTGADSFTLEPAPVADAGAVQLGPVRVAGTEQSGAGVVQYASALPANFAGNQVARGSRLGVLGNVDVLDSPFSTTSFTRDYLRDQQAVTIADVVANDPSVRVYTNGLSSSAGGGDTLFIRGFTVGSQDFLFDGIYGVTYTIIPVETMERVEVLKGPTAFLNGLAPRGSVGGAINVVPKRAGDTPITTATASYLSDDQFGGHVDVGRRLGADAQWGIRVNGIYRDGDGPIDGQSIRLGVLTAALDYRGESVRATLDAGYQGQKTTAPTGAAGIGFDASVPTLRAPRLSRQIYQNWEYMKSSDAYFLAKAEYDFARNWTVYGAVGYNSNRQEALSTDIYVTNSAGNGTATVYYSPIYGKTGSLQAGVRGAADTGIISHSFNFNGSYYFERMDQLSDYYGFTSFLTNIYHAPTVSRPSTAGFRPHPPRYWNINLPSVSASDTLSMLDTRIMLTLGLRYQVVKIDVFNPDGSRSQSYDKNAVTPAVGLVFKPAAGLSVYGNYIQGLQQGPTASVGTSNAGQIFPPARTEQMEAGVKYDLGAVLLTASIFQIRQPNGIITTDRTTSVPRFGVNGQQRNRGVEANVAGEAAKGLRVLGGVAYTRGTLVRTDDGAYDGKHAIGVPRWQGNAGLEWDPTFVSGLTLTGRMTLTGPQYTDVTNAHKLPGWSRFDIGARYRIDAMETPLTLRVAVDNLLGKDYWGAVNGGWVTTGTPRTFRVSASLDL